MFFTRLFDFFEVNEDDEEDDEELSDDELVMLLVPISTFSPVIGSTLILILRILFSPPFFRLVSVSDDELLPVFPSTVMSLFRGILIEPMAVGLPILNRLFLNVGFCNENPLILSRVVNFFLGLSGVESPSELDITFLLGRLNCMSILSLCNDLEVCSMEVEEKELVDEEEPDLFFFILFVEVEKDDEPVEGEESLSLRCLGTSLSDLLFEEDDEEVELSTSGGFSSEYSLYLAVLDKTLEVLDASAFCSGEIV